MLIHKTLIKNIFCCAKITKIFCRFNLKKDGNVYIGYRTVYPTTYVHWNRVNNLSDGIFPMVQVTFLQCEDI